jgi:nicotinamide riboside kinase
MGMDYKMNKNVWVIAGAESSGKTTLFELLKQELPKYQFVSEYNRDWLTKRELKAPFSIEILDQLFRDSLYHYQNLPLNHPTILDTDLLNLLLWAQHTHHPMCSELEKTWDKTQFSYLLCPPNIPFEQDPLRSGESVRQWAWEAHLQELKKRHCVVLEHNDASMRIQQAVQTILSIE